MLFVLSTRNPKKVEELRAVLSIIGHRLVSLSEYEAEHGISLPEVEETSDTFYGNALLKAESLAQHCRVPIIADDSGLVVPLLGGEPGIHSARYAQDIVKEVTHRDNIAKLHSRLRSHPDYRGETPAYFIAVIVALISPPAGGEAAVIVGEGRCYGKVIDRMKGEKGFGYDPIFVPDEENPDALTFAEMDGAKKNEISHRSRAIKDIIEKLKNSY